MREKGILKHLSPRNGPHTWRCNLASHLLESSDQNFPMSMNGLQSEHYWWHRHCTQCSCNNYPRGTGMKKTVMGITKPLLPQIMGKSWDQMCFCRSRVQWLRDTALEELFARAAEVTEEKRLTQLYVILDVLGHHFLVQFQFIVHWEGKKWSLSLHGSPALHTLSRRYRQSTGNLCWRMHFVQGAGKFPQHIGVAVTDWGINLDANYVSHGSQEVFKTLRWSFNTATCFFVKYTDVCSRARVWEDPIHFFLCVV